MGLPNITQEINTIKSTYLPLSGGTVKSLHVNSPLVVKAQNTTAEGGEIQLQYPSETYPYKSHIDNCAGNTRIFSVYNGKDAGVFCVDHVHNKCTFNGNEVLTSAGGTIKGTLYYGGHDLYCDKDNDIIGIYGGTHYTVGGASVIMHGGALNSEYGEGSISLLKLQSHSPDKTQSCLVNVHYQNGFTCNGKKVVCRENYTGTPNYIRFDNGLTFQWGYNYVNGNTSTVTFPIAFTVGLQTVNATPVGVSGDNNTTIQINGWTNTYFVPSFYDSDSAAARAGYIFWAAWGY
jgi:hypothetical protein